MADDAFVKLVGGDVNINASSATLYGGDGMNTVAEIASTAGWFDTNRCKWCDYVEPGFGC